MKSFNKNTKGKKTTARSRVKSKRAGGNSARGKTHASYAGRANPKTAKASKASTQSPSSALGQIIGTLQGHSKGFAFLIPDDKSMPDFFVPPSALNGAIHSDKVLCRIVRNGTKHKGGEAEVVSIIDRGFKRIVGTFQANGGYGFVVPDEKSISSDFFVARDDSMDARGGQKVVLEILDYPTKENGGTGRIIEILGYPEANRVDMLSIIRKYNLYEEFPEEVEREAELKPQKVSASEIELREDYRDTLIITIDGEDARDLDDAISISKNDEGIYTLGVHIADVSHYVKKGSLLDKEAYARGTSVYFPDSVLPMLPKPLSNGICSLNEHEDRLTLSAILKIDQNGKTVQSSIRETVINSKNRMTYTAVQAFLDGGKEERVRYAHLNDMLFLMKELATLLRKRRFKRGAIDLDIPESKITLNQKTGRVIKVEAYERLFSHFIIEEFMLSANEAVAEFMFKNKMPFVYRVHEKPSTEKIESLAEFTETFGLSLRTKGAEIRPNDLQALLYEATDKPYYHVVSKIILRSMQKAKYAPQNLGHFGLNAKYYCHFTSPIRRYPDLLIHRILKDYLKNGKANQKRYEKFTVEASEASSIRERLADEAEREVDDLKKAEYMEGKIGEVFEGVVSGVAEFGVFVELQNTCEGLIRLENLPGDNYTLNEKLHILQNKKNKFKLGDSLKIEVLNVNKAERKTEFVLAD